MEINIKGGSIVLGAIVMTGLAIYNKGKAKAYEHFVDKAIEEANNGSEDDEE